MRFDTREHFGTPIKVGDLTVTPVAKTRFLALNVENGAVVRLQTHPDRVEVRADDGRTWQVPIRDVESQVLGAIAGTGAILRFVIKSIKKGRRSDG